MTAPLPGIIMPAFPMASTEVWGRALVVIAASKAECDGVCQLCDSGLRRGARTYPARPSPGSAAPTENNVASEDSATKTNSMKVSPSSVASAPDAAKKLHRTVRQPMSGKEA
jgi:hypothetical protein